MMYLIVVVVVAVLAACLFFILFLDAVKFSVKFSETLSRDLHVARSEIRALEALCRVQEATLASQRPSPWGGKGPEETCLIKVRWGGEGGEQEWIQFDFSPEDGKYFQGHPDQYKGGALTISREPWGRGWRTNGTFTPLEWCPLPRSHE